MFRVNDWREQINRQSFKDIQLITDKVDNTRTRNYNSHNYLNAHRKDTLLWQKAF